MNFYAVLLNALALLGIAASKDLQQVLWELQRELNYETLLLVHCPAQLSVDVPRLLLNEQSSFYLKAQFNSRMLALLCLQPSEDENAALLKMLATNLQHIRRTPTVLVLSNQTELQLRQLFEQCWLNKMLNVIALPADSDDWHQQVHSYTGFPRFQLVERRLQPNQKYFLASLSNLGGYPVRSMTDHIMPRSVVHNDSRTGERRVCGYIAKMVKTFITHLNGTLRMHWNEKMLLQPDIANLTFQGKLDLPMSLFSANLYRNLQENTYPVEYSKWRLMLPVEPYVDISYLFFMVYKNLISVLIWLAFFSLTGLLIILQRLHARPSLRSPLDCVDKVLRGFIAQVFALPRLRSPTWILIYVSIAFSGLLLSNIYVAHLQMLLFHTPSQQPVRTYDDFRRNKLKILLLEAELSLMQNRLGKKLWAQYADIFHITSSIMDMQQLRGSLNTSYAYTVTSSLWPLLVERQSTLKRPLFRVDSNFILANFVQFTLPVEQNSIYKEAFHRYFAWVQSTGLMSHWFKESYFEMVQIGQLPYYQPDQTHIYRDMIWSDFKWIWLSLVFSNAFNILVFLLELFWAQKLNT